MGQLPMALTLVAMFLLVLINAWTGPKIESNNEVDNIYADLLELSGRQINSSTDMLT